MKKSKFNGQIINGMMRNFQNKEKIKQVKYKEKEILNKLKVNLSQKLKSTFRKNNQKDIISKISFLKIVSKNLKKYDSSPDTKNIMVINNLIKCKNCHLLAKFKDYLIIDFAEEFFRRLYLKKESIERMPKIYNYYKNYLKFFCKPTFIVAFANEILKNYSDLNAECFYKSNFDKKNSKRKRKILDNKIIEEDNNNYKINGNEQFVKTVFTKSIKNSLDNIKEDDFSLSEKKGKNFYQNEGETIVKIYGNDEDDNNFLLNNNSLLLMINEIKDVKDGRNNNKKPIIKEKTIKIINNINNDIENNRYTFIDTPINNNLNVAKKRNNKINKRNFNLEKANTCMNNLLTESLKNMIYSPKSNKKGVFFLKKNDNNKIERYFSPKTGKEKNHAIQKNPSSIIVNINININTNQENINNKINTSNNKLDNNLIYKSPSHQISKKKNLFAFSPITSSDITNYKYDRPLLTARDEKTIESNYIKIVKRNRDYNNIILNTDRNKKKKEMKKTRTLSSLECLDLFKNQNDSYNKNDIFYNKQIFTKKNKQIKNAKNNKININNKVLYSSNNNNINSNLYISPNKFGKKHNLNKINKNLEVNNDNKKFIYHKKSNNILSSPLNKKDRINKKYIQIKKE